MKQYDGSKTALLRVQSDVLTGIDGGKCAQVIMVDLSAPFTAIDHHILHSRLESVIGVSGRHLIG